MESPPAQYAAPEDHADLARAGKYPGYDQPRPPPGAYDQPRYDEPQGYARAPPPPQSQQQALMYGYDQRFVRTNTHLRRPRSTGARAVPNLYAPRGARRRAGASSPLGRSV